MAIYSEGTVSPDNDSLWSTIQTFLTAESWTIHDIASGADTPGDRHKIFRSPSMGGTADVRAYMGVRMVGTQTSFSMYSQWDDSAKVGQHEAATGVFDQNLNGWNYFIRVNNWAMALVLESGGVYHKGYAGMTRRAMRLERSGRAKVTTMLMGGETTVPVNVDLTWSLRPGQHVILYNSWNDSVMGQWQASEKLIVQSVTSGTVTFTTPVVNAYDMDAILGENPLPICVVPLFNNSNTSILYPYQGGVDLALGTYPGSPGTPGYCWPMPTTVPTFTTPQASDGFYGGGVYVANQGPPYAYYGSLYHYEICNYAAVINNFDVMDDTVDQFRVIADGDTTRGCLLIGPM